MRWKKEKITRKGSALKSIYIDGNLTKEKIDEIFRHKFFKEMEKEQLPRRTTEVMYINFQTIKGFRSYTKSSGLSSKFSVEEIKQQFLDGLSDIEERYKQFKEFGDFTGRPRSAKNLKNSSDRPFKKESINKITFNYVN